MRRWVSQCQRCGWGWVTWSGCLWGAVRSSRGSNRERRCQDNNLDVGVVVSPLVVVSDMVVVAEAVEMWSVVAGWGWVR